MKSMQYFDKLNSIKCGSIEKPWKQGFNKAINKHIVESSLIEAACAAEFSLRHIFNQRNIPDDLFKAYDASFSNSGSTIYEHYQQALENGDSSVQGFLSNLKGKLFEIKLEPKLEEAFPHFDFSMATDPTNQVWDLIGTNTHTGEHLSVQAKMGASSYTADVIDRMHENPHVLFALSSDLTDKIVSIDPSLSDHIFNSGIDSSHFTNSTDISLHTLAQNLGIDIPDGVGDLIPYTTEIVLAIRLLYDIIQVNRDYKHVHSSDKTKLYAFKLLMLMSRYGVSAICIPLGGLVGTAIPIPVLGTLGGAAAGWWLAKKITKYLEPHFQDVSLWLLGLDKNDVFYLKNKLKIDAIGLSYMKTAKKMAA